MTCPSLSHLPLPVVRLKLREGGTPIHVALEQLCALMLGQHRCDGNQAGPCSWGAIDKFPQLRCPRMRPYAPSRLFAGLGFDGNVVQLQFLVIQPAAVRQPLGTK